MEHMEQSDIPSHAITGALARGAEAVAAALPRGEAGKLRTWLKLEEIGEVEVPLSSLGTVEPHPEQAGHFSVHFNGLVERASDHKKVLLVGAVATGAALLAGSTAWGIIRVRNARSPKR